MQMSNEDLAVRAEVLSVAADSNGETEICRQIAARLRAIDGLEAIVRGLADNHTVVIEGQETTPRGAAIWWCEKHPEVK